MPDSESGFCASCNSHSFCPTLLTTPAIADHKRWSALILLCLGELMIVLDTTIVNVALPSIQADLQFSETALVWVVNAYMLTYGGCLLLGGRLGDLYGHRRLFLAGIVAFTLASLACGLAQTQTLLVAARAVQGLGGAVVSAVALSLIMNLFTEPHERARAMGVYGFVCAGGGSGRAAGRRADQRAELALGVSGQPAAGRGNLLRQPGPAARRPGAG
jgi:MFS family permease